MASERFLGKSVLVVGGSRGIGAAVARRLAREGASVAVGYRSAAHEAETLVTELTKGGAKATAIRGDIGLDGQPHMIVESARATLGGLDIVINTAGIGPYRALEMVDEAYVRDIFDTNVLGAIMLTKAAAAVLPKPGGRIVHVSSRLAYSPIPTSTVYSASKAAVTTLTHGFAKELGPMGITINAVAPGVIETDMTADIISKRGESIKAGTPLGRIGQPDDVVGVIAFLASDDAGWVTGRTIVADGGFL